MNVSVWTFSAASSALNIWLRSLASGTTASDSLVKVHWGALWGSRDPQPATTPHSNRRTAPFNLVVSLHSAKRNYEPEKIQRPTRWLPASMVTRLLFLEAIIARSELRFQPGLW